MTCLNQQIIVLWIISVSLLRQSNSLLSICHFGWLYKRRNLNVWHPELAKAETMKAAASEHRTFGVENVVSVASIGRTSTQTRTRRDDNFGSDCGRKSNFKMSYVGREARGCKWSCWMPILWDQDSLWVILQGVTVTSAGPPRELATNRRNVMKEWGSLWVR